MNHEILNGIVILIALGAVGQWVAWRWRVPSILVLLSLGFVVGPLTGWFRPEEVLGEVTFPFVSIAAAIVLFEGGLTASLEELRGVATPVRRLIVIGIPVTWAVLTAAAHWTLGLSIPIALLLGAILVVTGPTVIGPLLRHARPKAQVTSILKLEGILNDPLGAILAVLVFQGIRAGETEQALSLIGLGILKAAVLSVAVGLFAAFVFVKLLERDMLPEFLHNAIVLPAALVAFAVANYIQAESGLLAVTVMGVALASQKRVSIEQSVEFTEHVRVLLISALFILLTARMRLSDFEDLSFGAVAFIVAVIFVARPLSVYLSTIRSGLVRNERAFIAAVAPRGVVAAAVSSVFALELTDAGFEEASVIMPVTFLVIASTVVVYGFSAKPLARWLGVAQDDVQGVLVLGADRFARALAQSLGQKGFRAVLVDSDWGKIRRSHAMGLEAEHGGILHRPLLRRLDLDGIGRFLALTPNDELNALACSHFAKVFGNDNVFQLEPGLQPGDPEQDFPKELLARFLAPGSDHDKLASLTKSGAAMTWIELDGELPEADFHERFGPDAVPLFAVDEEGNLGVMTATANPEGPRQLLCLTP